MIEVVDEKLDYSNRVVADGGVVVVNNCISWIYTSNELLNLKSMVNMNITLNSII